MTELNIPGYKIIKELGRGGMATVYLAMQESVERKVALKVMLQALAADPSFSERFLREAKIVAQLSHPNIVAVFDVAISDQNHYIAMEYHEGGELKDKITEGLSIKEILMVTKQMATALDFAHKKGYVHRDIKPENVLFKSDGNIVLSDFGIARASDANTRMTATGSVIGTPHYMSPEQAQGQELDGRSDLYSLGVVFFEMLVGTVPYKGDSALSVGIKHLRDPIPKLPGHYQMFQTFLDKLMAKEPENRWQTGADIVNTLETLELQSGSVLGSATAQNTAVNTAAVNSGVNATVVTGQTTQSTLQQTAATAPLAKSGGAFKWVLASLLLIGLGGGGFYYTKIEPDALQSIFGKPETSAANPKEVKKLLAEANQTISKQNFSNLNFRDKSSATKDVIAKYRQVLKLDPGNKDAQDGLRNLAGKLIDRAKQSIGDNKLTLAERQLDIAESIDPAHPDLIAARRMMSETQDKNNQLAAKNRQQSDRLTRAQQAEKRQQSEQRRAKARELDRLLEQADDLLSPYRLTPERIVGARDTFSKAAKIAPRNTRVADGERRVADAYLRLATDLTDQKKYDDAKTLVAKGLSVIPNHSRLRDLEAYIAKQAGAKKRRSFGGF